MKLKPLINWTPERYDRLSSNYDFFAKWLFPIGEKGRDRVVSDIESGSILDIACGTGTLLAKAQLSGLHCIGIDTSCAMLIETKKKVPAVVVVQASFYALPFAANQFDYVVETNAVSGADINADKVLGEMLRVCADGGEVRLGDYGKSGREGLWIRIMEMIGILFGDFPHDYQEIFSELGYEAEIEDLGWGGSYKYFKAVKQQKFV